jgi:fido (protein-threonine AMPylation protein)
LKRSLLVPVAWDDDSPSDTARLTANIAGILRRVVDQATPSAAPTVAMAQQWHRDLYDGIALPVAYYAGEVRDSDPEFPELIDYEVRVGRFLGVPSRDVPIALVRFEHDFGDAVSAADAELLTHAGIDAVGAQLYVTLAAVTHGEWIRIHPFANGNGRIARLWTHWLAARYNLPPLMQVKPRPSDRAYAHAATAAMEGDHRPMRAWLLDQFRSSM